ncbi:MAG: hypothetical protein ONB06_05205, partial [candidate division KSB1 bacterium]|nr:hypothetical protein [candidate division KSB1 bacterium]
MSDLLRTMNLIKMKRGIGWLTPSQRHALEVLRGLLRVPNCVNLYGLTGTGKTFLAWILADEFGYSYFPHRTHFEQAKCLGTQGVIIDNMESGHQAHRDMLKLLDFRQVRYAVLVTRQVIQDYTHCVEL